MDRENDIFNQPSKVQNMNFLFEEDADPINLDETQSLPASRRTRQAESNGASVSRGRKVESGGTSQRQRQQRSASAQGSSNRSSQGRAPQNRSASQARTSQSRSSQGYAQNAQVPKVQNVAPMDDGLFETEEIFKNIRQAQPTNAENARAPRNVAARPMNNKKNAASPRKAQPKQINSSNTQKPRKARPTEAQPRQVRAASGNASANRRSSQNTDARRINRNTQNATASRGGRGGKKRSSKFKKFLIIYAAALLVILIVGMIIFGSFLKSLEKSQPSNIAKNVAENLVASKAPSFLKDNADAINCFGEPDDLIATFATNVEGVESLSFIENKDYRADAPSYNITADGNTVAKLTLKKSGSGSFGLSKWAIDKLDIADYMDTASYEFLAPLGATITINGVELDEKYLTGEESIPQNLEIASKYVTIPSYMTYKVAGIAGTPEIKATDAAGAELTITATDNKYVIGSATDQAFIDSVSGLVDDAVQAWGKHFINMGGNLSAYMLEGSDWYSYIFGGPDMDPIYTAFYEFESIADYSFTEKGETNYIRYTKDCFTVDVNYKMQVDFNTDRMSDNNQKLDATWVFITQNDGQDWYLVDCIYK